MKLIATGFAMIRVMYYILLLPFWLRYQVDALSTGSPICKVDKDLITKGHKANATTVGYSLTVDQEPDGKGYSIRVSGPTYNGLLLYVVSGTSKSNHLGSFAIQDTENFQHLGSICATQNILGSATSTVTHSNDASKTSSSIFTWRPNQGEEEEPDLRIVAVVSGKQKPWQILEEYLLSSSSIPIIEEKSSTTSTRVPSPAPSPTLTPPQQDPKPVPPRNTPDQPDNNNNNPVRPNPIQTPRKTAPNRATAPTNPRQRKNCLQKRALSLPSTASIVLAAERVIRNNPSLLAKAESIVKNPTLFNKAASKLASGRGTHLSGAQLESGIENILKSPVSSLTDPPASRRTARPDTQAC
jgi:hypothetical protein